MAEELRERREVLPEPEPTPEQIETEIEATEETVEDIDELSEQLAVHSIISEERHEQILGEVGECQEKLNQLTVKLEEQSQNPQAESPTLHRILEEVTQLRSRMDQIESSLSNLWSRSAESMLPNQTPSESRQQNLPAEAESPVAEISQKRRRFRVL